MVLPDVMHTVGDLTFSGCTTLRKVQFPANLVAIGKDTFLGAEQIRTVKRRRELWEASRQLILRLFKKCHQLTTINIPHNVVS
jgi:hypothetical protein